jgi:predicted MPP superfamily phosphohydrolase
VLLPVVIAIAAAATLVVGYAVLIERRWYAVRRHRLAILPGSSRLTVLHLSDLHLLDGEEGKRRFLGSLPRADVTVVTGDMVGEPEAVEFAVATLRSVRGRLASLFVLGSNDLFAPRPLNYLRYFFPKRGGVRPGARRGRAADLVRQLEADGWVHLKNRKYTRRSNGLRLEVVGLDDPHIHRNDARVAPRTDADAFGLAVVHAPDPAPELAALGYDLIVAGHTHGGQVRLPWIGALVSNSTVPPRMARGLFRMGRSFLNVSAGIGTSKYAPFRLFCRPEVSLLELEPATDRDLAPAAGYAEADRTRA